mmetsp:Transcript_79131/g.218963  ORF Transcript_79131/g.218963 Transcript_79131/m.218963 type:complete len:209 (+) Transcript_79131:121-747(+)
MLAGLWRGTWKSSVLFALARDSPLIAINAFACPSPAPACAPPAIHLSSLPSLQLLPCCLQLPVGRMFPGAPWPSSRQWHTPYQPWYETSARWRCASRPRTVHRPRAKPRRRCRGALQLALQLRPRLLQPQPWHALRKRRWWHKHLPRMPSGPPPQLPPRSEPRALLRRCLRLRPPATRSTRSVAQPKLLAIPVPWKAARQRPWASSAS